MDNQKPVSISVMPKRSFILKWGNIVLLILMVALALFIISTTDPNTEQATLASFLGTIAFFLTALGIIVLGIVRLAKKYHRARSWIWIFITPILTILLLLSFIPR